MEKEFVPYELAVKLKELGFDEPCLANYVSGTYGFEKIVNTLEIWNDEDVEILHSKIKAPLWSQAFDWFRENFNLLSCIGFQNDYQYSYEIYDIKKKDCVDYVDKIETYEEARKACLEKLIELCENN